MQCSVYSQSEMLKNLNEKACHTNNITLSHASLAHTVHASYMKVLSCFFQSLVLGCCVVLFEVSRLSVYLYVAEGKMTWLVKQTSRTTRNQNSVLFNLDSNVDDWFMTCGRKLSNSLVVKDGCSSCSVQRNRYSK